MSFILAFFLTFAYASLPPTTLKNQDGTAKPTTFNFEVPHYQATRTGSTTGLIETGNNNLLLNSSFEDMTLATGWTVNGTPSADTTTYLDGKKALTVTLSAYTGTILEQNYSDCGRLDGFLLEAALFIKTSLSNIQMCSLSAGTEVQCWPVDSSGAWKSTPLNFSGMASNSCGVRVKSISSATGTIGFDSGYLGISRNIGSVGQSDILTKVAWGASTAANSWSDLGGTGVTTFGDSSLYNDTTKNTTLSAPGRYEITVNVAFVGGGSATGIGLKVNGVQVGETSVFAGTGGDSGGRQFTYSFQLANGSSAVVRPMHFVNSGTFGISGAVMSVKYFPLSSSPAIKANIPSGPTVTRITTPGSGTYTVPAGATSLRIKMVGGGGGGEGGGTAGTRAGGTGGNTVFGTSLLLATGGTGGDIIAQPGGTTSVSSPAITVAALSGATGNGRSDISASGPRISGAPGASSPLGGAGGGDVNNPGKNAAVNTGSGGGGGGSPAASGNNGAGGAAGGYIEAIINNPLASYTYTVGAAGTAGPAGTSGFAGGAGGSGYIEITEYYGAQAGLVIPGNVSSSSGGSERIDRAILLTNAGTCTIQSQSGSWIGSTTHTANGDCTLNFATAWPSAPACICTPNDGSGTTLLTCAYVSKSTSSVRFQVKNNGTLSASAFDVICMGPR